ncbi:CBS domain-containing protein, partial [Enterococcus faecium]
MLQCTHDFVRDRTYDPHMIVGMWMSKHLVVVGPETGVTEAARLMKDNRIRRLPVATGSGEELHLL